MFKDTHGLIERCICREEKAWTEFIDRFSGLLYYSATQRLRRSSIAFDKQDIEDVVQGVFLEIWEKRNLEDVRKRNKIDAWLSIMAQTRALNYMRQKKDRLLREDELPLVEEIEARTTAGEAKNGLMERLEGLIEQFGANEKIIFKLNIFHGKTHREIAEFMNIPVNTVSTVIARKKKLLREKLGDIYDE